MGMVNFTKTEFFFLLSFMSFTSLCTMLKLVQSNTIKLRFMPWTDRINNDLCTYVNIM